MSDRKERAEVAAKIVEKLTDYVENDSRIFIALCYERDSIMYRLNTSNKLELSDVIGIIEIIKFGILNNNKMDDHPGLSGLEKTTYN